MTFKIYKRYNDEIYLPAEFYLKFVKLFVAFRWPDNDGIADHNVYGLRIQRF